MDKLIVNERGEAQITNDGATILKLLDIVHPAARTLVDIARAQDAEVGDGTTSVVLLAAQLLKEVRGYIEEGVSPHVIMKGFRKASQLVRRSHYFCYRFFDILKGTGSYKNFAGVDRQRRSRVSPIGLVRTEFD
jgi:hypothetical protein